jgi:hypothetical protein
MQKWLIALSGTMLFASVACGQYKSNAAPPAPAPSPVAQATPPVAVPPPFSTSTPIAEQADGARRIPEGEAIKMVKAGKAVYLDVRPKDQYDIEHIKGSLSYPLGDLQADLQAKMLDRLPKNKFLITYCA